MIAIATDKTITIYDIDSENFDELASYYSDEQINLIVNNPGKSLLVRYGLCFGSKEEYTEEFINRMKNIGFSLDKIDAVYRYDGQKLIKTEISNIRDLFEDTDLVPSVKSNDESSEVKIDEEYRRLIDLDYRLNNCVHISMVLDTERLEEFRKLYDVGNTSFQYSYEVTPMSKLIVRNNNKKLTANGLENNVFVMMARAGMNDSGDITYFINEYRITAGDIQSIKNLFTALLKKDEVKATDISEQDRYMYYNEAVKQHITNIINQLGNFNSQSSSLLSSIPKTWKEYKSEFLNKYGYPVSDISDDGWLMGKPILLDARTVKDGMIIPATIESYSIKEKHGEEQVTEEEKEKREETIKPSREEDSKLDSFRVFLESAGYTFDEDGNVISDTKVPTPVAPQIETPGYTFDANGNVVLDINAQTLTDPQVDAPSYKFDASGKVLDDATAQEPGADLFKAPETTEPGADLFGTPETAEPNADLFKAPETAEPNADLFKAPETAEPGADLFGAPETAEPNADLFKVPETAEPGADLFGAPETAEPGADLFGAPETAEPGADLFGAPETAEPGADLFKAPETAEPNADLFKAPETTEPGADLFGAPETAEPEADLFKAPETIEVEPRFIDLNVPQNKYIVDGKYIVEPNDTLSIVASRFGIGESYLRTVNDLDDDKLVPGMELIIPSYVPETADIQVFKNLTDEEEIEDERPFLVPKRSFKPMAAGMSFDLDTNKVNETINRIKRLFNVLAEQNDRLNALSLSSNDFDITIFQKQTDLVISYEQLDQRFNKIVYDYQQGISNSEDIINRLEQCEVDVQTLKDKFTDFFNLVDNSTKKAKPQSAQLDPELGMMETLRDRYVFDGEGFIESNKQKKM